MIPPTSFVMQQSDALQPDDSKLHIYSIYDIYAIYVIFAIYDEITKPICSFNKSVSFSYQTEQRIKEEAHFGWQTIGKTSKLSLSGENTLKTRFKVDRGSPFPNCCYLNDF